MQFTPTAQFLEQEIFTNDLHRARSALNLSGIRYLLSNRPISFEGMEPVFQDGPLRLVQNLQAQPRAFLEGDAGKIDMTETGPEGTSLRVSLPGPARLILTETAYPGWKAFVDGRRVPIFAEPGPFRTIEVPGGEHSVLFRYHSTLFLIGLAGSMIFFVCLLFSLKMDL